MSRGVVHDVPQALDAAGTSRLRLEESQFPGGYGHDLVGDLVFAFPAFREVGKRRRPQHMSPAACLALLEDQQTVAPDMLTTTRRSVCSLIASCSLGASRVGEIRQGKKVSDVGDGRHSPTAFSLMALIRASLRSSWVR